MQVKELRKIRIAAGLTQQQIAARMGVCRQRIVQIEGDERVSRTTELRFREAVRDAHVERERLSDALPKATGKGSLDFENRKIGRQ